MRRLLDRWHFSAPKEPTQHREMAAEPTSQELVQKLESFFGNLPKEKHYRLNNIRTIYEAVQQLVAQAQAQPAPTELSRPIRLTAAIELSVAPKINGEIVVKSIPCILELLISSLRYVTLTLIEQYPSNPGLDIGTLVVSGVRPGNDRPTVYLESTLYSGSGIGTGLGVCVNAICQLAANTSCSPGESVTIAIVDDAHNQRHQHRSGTHNTRYNWTATLTALDPSWHRTRLDKVMGIFARTGPRFTKVFYPQKTQP